MLASLVGGVIGVYGLSFLESGGTSGGFIMGSFFGLPVGVFIGMLIVDLPRVGFRDYHLVGFAGSLVVNFGMVIVGQPLIFVFLPPQVATIVLLLLLVTTCVTCYNVSQKKLAKIDREAK